MWTVIIVLVVVLWGDFIVHAIFDKLDSASTRREIEREAGERMASMEAEIVRLQAETAQIEKDMQEKRDFIERHMEAYEERGVPSQTSSAV